MGDRAAVDILPKLADKVPLRFGSILKNARMASLTPDLPKTEMAVVEMTNAFRAQNRLGAVRLNPALSATARAYGRYLAQTSSFSHTADGREPAERASSAGYSSCEIAENLALNLDSRGFETRQLATLAVEGWIRSPGHRANMLLPYVTEIGVAVVRAADAKPKYISVQLFGRPLALQYEFQIINGSKSTITYSFAGEAHNIGPNYAVTHTACEPGQVTFETDSGGLFSKAVNASYEAKDGHVYTLKTAPGGGVSVEVARRASQ